MPLEAMKRITKNGSDESTAARYIETYFEPQANGRPRFTGSRFETFTGGDAEEPNRITPADLTAVSMLSVHVRGQAALGITETLAGDIEPLLRKIPVNAKLEEIDAAEFARYLGKNSVAAKLWDLLRQHRDRWRVGQTTASKILARKRPHLIPIYDSVVAAQTTRTDSKDYWQDWFDAFQGEEGRDLAGQLGRIREQSGQDHLSLLRVLDIVLWMDGTHEADTSERVDDGEN
jgi:hypothetical protein